jgi:hypothetical protein
MIIISLTSYPTESVNEIGKRFMELPPLADYITMKGPYISSDVGESIKGITIYEFDESRYAEAMNYLGERVATLFGVPGFTYSLKHWLEVQDALKMIGLG